jgi:hypothetical protein
MQEVDNYNSRIKATTENKFQHSFRIQQDQGTKAKRDQFAAEMRQAISMFLSGMNMEDGIRCIPMARIDFDGIKNGDNVLYSTVTAVGFPYRIGAIKYQHGNTRFYKFGIIVERGVSF